MFYYIISLKGISCLSIFLTYAHHKLQLFRFSTISYKQYLCDSKLYECIDISNLLNHHVYIIVTMMKNCDEHFSVACLVDYKL